MRKGDRRRSLGAVALLWLLTVFGGATAPCALAGAQARWSAPQALGRGDFSVGEGAPLFGDERGHTALVWRSQHGLRIAFAAPGGLFGPSRVIARRIDGGVYDAMDGHGDAIVAWDYSDESAVYPEIRGGQGDCCDHVRIAMVGAGGRSVTFQTLTPARVSADVRGVAISNDGRTVAVAYESASKGDVIDGEGYAYRRHLYLRLAHFGQRFGRRVNLGSRRRLIVPLQAQTGRVTAVMQEEGLPYTEETQVSQSGRIVHRATGEEVEPPGEEPAYQFASQYDARGDQALLMTREFGKATEERVLELATRARKSSEFRLARLASARHPRGSETPWPWWSSTLAVAPSGRMLVAWSDTDGLHGATGHLPRVRLRRAPVLDPTTPSGERIDFAGSAAVDSRGQGVILATRARTEDNGSAAQTTALIAILCSATGRFGRLVVLDDSPRLSPWGPSVAIDGHGRGMAVWHESGERIVARRFQAP